MGKGIKLKIRTFYFNFFNSEFSFNNPSIITKFLQVNLKTLPEGIMSQNFVLGSRYFFMLCRILKIHFFTIFYILWYEIKTRA